MSDVSEFFEFEMPLPAGADGYVAHQAVWAAFNRPVGAARPFLFRREGKRARVRSTIPPAGIVPRRVLACEFGQGLRAFSLRCAPSRKHGRWQDMPERITPLRDFEDMRAWLARQLASIGAELRYATFTPPRRRVMRAGRAAWLETEASGLLLIADRTAFFNGLATGIGRHRAFGLGMIDV